MLFRSGDKVIVKDGLICRFFDFNQLDDLLTAIQEEKQEKIKKYGLQNYQKYMEKDSKNTLYKRFKKVKGEIKDESNIRVEGVC